MTVQINLQHLCSNMFQVIPASGKYWLQCNYSNQVLYRVLAVSIQKFITADVVTLSFL